MRLYISRRIVTNVVVFTALGLSALFACSAFSRPDPWEEYKKRELTKINALGKPEGFYSVYEGSFGPAKIKLATWMLGEDNFRLDSDMGIIKVMMGYSHGRGWVKMPGAAARALSGAEEAEILSSKYYDGLDFLTDEKLQVESAGKTAWDDAKAWEVKLTSPGGYRRDLFIADDTWELVGYRSYGTSTVLIKLYENEYVGAVQVPRRIVMEIEGLKIPLEFKLLEAREDKEIAPELFLPPVESTTPLVAAVGVRELKLSLVSPEKGMVLIPGKVGGASATFLLDTGASHTVIDSTLVTELAPIEESDFATVGVAGEEGAKVVRAKNAVGLGAGGEVALPAETSFITMNLAPISKSLGIPISGILGAELIARAKIDLYFGKGYIRIKPYTKEEMQEISRTLAGGIFGGGEKEKKLAENEYALESLGDLMTINAKLGDGRDVVLLVDTGFQGDLGLLSTGVDRLGLTMKPAASADKIAGIGGVTGVSGFVAALSVTALGRDFNLAHVPVIAGSVASLVGGTCDGIIGIKALSDFNLEFDYANGIIRVLP